MLKGRCYFFSETGTEGGYWAFQEDGCDPRSYDGLHILENGDRLTVFNPRNRKQKIWSGVISLKEYSPFAQAVFWHWIHADQKGIRREKWAQFFFKEYPAELIPIRKK